MHPCISNYYLVFQVSLPVSFSDAFILTLLLETMSQKLKTYIIFVLHFCPCYLLAPVPSSCPTSHPEPDLPPV